MDMPGEFCHFIAQTYLGKITEGVLSTPCGSDMAAKRWTCGVSKFITPRLGYEGFNSQL